MHWVRLIGWGLCWLLGLVMLVLGLALSPWGTGWLLGQAKSHGWIEYSKVEGAPLDHLHIEGLDLSLGGTHISAQQLNLKWATDCLLHGRLCIEHLSGKGIHVVLNGTSQAEDNSDKEKNTGWGRYSTPLPLELRQLSADDVSVELADGTRIQWQHFSSSASFAGSRLSLGDTRLDAPEVYLPATDTPTQDATTSASNTSLHSQLNVAAASSVTTPESTQAAALTNPLAALAEPGTSEDRQLKLAEINLPVDIVAPSLRISNFTMSGSQQVAIDHIDAGIYAIGSRLAIDHLDMAGPSLNAHLAGVAELKGDFPITLGAHVDSNIVPLKGEQLDLAVSGSLADLELQLAARGPQPLALRAHARVLDRQLPFDVEVNSPQVQWPLPGMEAATDRTHPVSSYRVKQLSLVAKGDLEQYTAAVQGQVSGSQLKPIGLNLKGEGDGQQFNWQALTLDAHQGGSIASQGSARWAPNLAVNATVSLDRLKPQYFTSVVSGDISGKAQLAFTQQGDAAWQAAVKGLSLTGSLMGQRLSAAADLSANSQLNAVINTLRIDQGPNHLNASGRVGQQLDLSADIDAPRLATLLPELKGSLQGHVNTAGSLKAPRGDIKLTGSQLGYGTNQISRLSLSGNSQGIDDPRFNLALVLDGITAGSQHLSHGDIELTGRMSRHQLSARLEGGDNGMLEMAGLVLKGGYDRSSNRYSGTLERLSARQAQAGHLGLDKPVSLSADLGAGRYRVAPFCLVRREGGSLCLNKGVDASAQQGAASLELHQLPLDVANAYLPDPWQLNGNANAVFDAHWANGGQRFGVNGQLDSKVDVKGQNSNGQPVTLPGLAIDGKLAADERRAHLTLGTHFDNAGDITLDTAVSDPLGARRLSGTLNVNQLRFSPWQRLVPMLDRLSGQLNGQVDVAGTATQPRLNGQLAATGIETAGAQLPVELNDSEVRLTLAGDHGTLDGALVSGNTRWPLSGTADWPTVGNWQASAHIDGSQSPLRAQALQYGQLSIAPDIHVKASPQDLAISGNIDIPWARLKVAELPTFAQAPSTDEVILTREQAEQLDEWRNKLHQPVPPRSPAEARAWANAGGLTQAGMALDLQVGIRLGKDVHLSAYGLDTNLTGHLNATENNQGAGALQLYGDIQLTDGQYVSFGQRLLINTGKITFNGPPSLPRLDIDAIRNPDTIEDNVTAGIKVTGTAEAPRLQIYSDPAMNETTALSYLLRGHAPDSDGNDNALTQALIGLSISQSGRAVGALGQAFGVQDLQLDTKGVGDDSQVVVSGYLNPDLKVSYGVGVFSSIAELTLRYRLLQNLYVQAVSGGNQALDLLYSFHLGRTHLSDNH